MLLEIYQRWGDRWLVELLFDDLLDWSDWFAANRLLAPLNITALGGDDMQAARYESGLDNSPMCAVAALHRPLLAPDVAPDVAPDLAPAHAHRTSSDAAEPLAGTTASSLRARRTA